MVGKGRQCWLSLKGSLDGIEWASAFFHGLAFSPHRHDTYAIGYTTTGVQSFGYRGERRYSCVGDLFILHPDELHDGRQGTNEGYGYRIVYLAPNLISDALGGKVLPFIPDAVTRDSRLRKAVAEAFPDPDETEDDLFRNGAITAIADAMNQLAKGRAKTRARVDIAKMRRVRDHLLQKSPRSVSMANLEHEHGIDRFSLSRQFRMTFGVSPHRFVTLRRLDIAKRHIAGGQSLAEAAFLAGFADQSHMTRQFRKAFGLSPGTWENLLI